MCKPHVPRGRWFIQSVKTFTEFSVCVRKLFNSPPLFHPVLLPQQAITTDSNREITPFPEEARDFCLTFLLILRIQLAVGRQPPTPITHLPKRDTRHIYRGRRWWRQSQLSKSHFRKYNSYCLRRRKQREEWFRSSSTFQNSCTTDIGEVTEVTEITGIVEIVEIIDNSIVIEDIVSNEPTLYL